VLAGVFAVIGVAADPAAGISDDALFRIYAANPDPLQFKSLGFHWSYAFWMVPALLIAPYVRGRGAWLENVTAFIGFAGMTTLPGLLFIDWYDSAVGQVYQARGQPRCDRADGADVGCPRLHHPRDPGPDARAATNGDHAVLGGPGSLVGARGSVGQLRGVHAIQRHVVDKVPSPVPAPTVIRYVTNFWVMPAERSQGVGTELLAAMRE